MAVIGESGNRLGGQTAAAPTAAPTRPLDLATLLGLVGAFALIIVAVWWGGSIRAFFDLPSMLIVLGGTFAVTTISFSLQEVIQAQPMLVKALVHSTPDLRAAAVRVLGLAEIARAGGLLKLEDSLPRLREEPFLHRAISLVVEGTPADEIERILAGEMAATNARHGRSAGILRRASEVAPAMGLIGTLVGLVQMLGNLDDPSTVGPSMAVALITTFYGALLANMVFAPLASKLERNAAVEGTVDQIYALGAVSISRQKSLRRLEMLLNAVLPPAERLHRFD